MLGDRDFGLFGPTLLKKPCFFLYFFKIWQCFFASNICKIDSLKLFVFTYLAQLEAPSFAPETAPKPGRWTGSVTCSRSPRGPRSKWSHAKLSPIFAPNGCAQALLRQKDQKYSQGDCSCNTGPSALILRQIHCDIDLPQ